MNGKYLKITFITAVIILIVGVITLCIYGEYMRRKNYKSNVTNAEEVIVPYENRKEVSDY